MAGREKLAQGLAFQEVLQRAQPAEWARQMIDHHRRTGTYRPQDLRRLLGDQTQGVELGPNSSLATHLSRSGRSS
jgi:hypothetical protein